MVRPINKHTDSDGNKMLRTKAVQILSVTDDLKAFVDDLAETCLADPNCVGLSSNQIWTDIIEPPPAIFVIRMADEGIMAFVNPVLIKIFKKSWVLNEGCMSAPGQICQIERPQHICVSYMDVYGNQAINQHFFQMPARIWLHEYDHLQGKLILDYE